MCVVYYQYEHACKAERNEDDISQEHPVVDLGILHVPNSKHYVLCSSCGYYNVVGFEVVIDSLSQCGVERTAQRHMITVWNTGGQPLTPSQGILASHYQLAHRHRTSSTHYDTDHKPY